MEVKEGAVQTFLEDRSAVDLEDRPVGILISLAVTHDARLKDSRRRQPGSSSLRLMEVVVLFPLAP